MKLGTSSRAVKRQKKLTPNPTGGHLVGYARVSTKDQNLQLQVDALRAAGVREDDLHVESLSAVARERPMLDMAIKDLREGDTLLVWRLDRFARSMRDLYSRLDRVYAKGAKFRSLTEHFDFDTFTGKLVLGILGLVAEFERQIIAHRTSAGIAAYRERTGKEWGQHQKLTEAQIVEAGRLLNRDHRPLNGPQVAKRFNVSAPTIYAHYKLNRSGRGPRFIRKRKSK